MSDIESKAVRAGHAYFKGNVDRDEKGSAMGTIAGIAAATRAKSERLKAEREARDKTVQGGRKRKA